MAAKYGPDTPEYGDSIDAATFEQILEMDDDEEREFSRSIVYGFFDQADSTFKDMEQQIENMDLQALSSLGHFLKGSSATLGLTKVKDGCEKIQNYGSKKNEKGDAVEGDDDYFLTRITKLLPKLKSDYEDARRRLKAFFEA